MCLLKRASSCTQEFGKLGSNEPEAIHSGLFFRKGKNKKVRQRYGINIDGEINDGLSAAYKAD